MDCSGIMDCKCNTLKAEIYDLKLEIKAIKSHCNLTINLIDCSCGQRALEKMFCPAHGYKCDKCMEGRCTDCKKRRCVLCPEWIDYCCPKCYE